MKRMTEDIIIIGGLHHNTLGVVRSLGEARVKKANIMVLLVGDNIPKKNIITASKYVLKSNIITVSCDVEAFEWLMKQKKAEKTPCVICCSDGSAEMILSHASVLSKWYKLPEIKEKIQNMMQKDYQNAIATESGFLVPENIIVETNTDNLQWDIFPCITKPIKSTNGNGKGDIKIAYSKEELDRYLATIAAEKIEIQRFIEKKMEFQLIGCSIDGGNEVIIPGYTNIIRQPMNTNTGYLKYATISELNYDSDAVTLFLKKLGYSGLFSLEFVRDYDDNDYFLEINLRNDGNAYCVTSAGVNLPYIWYFNLVNGRKPEISNMIEKNIFFMPEFTDFKLGAKSEGIFRWMFQFFTSESHALYNRKDMKPFLIQLEKYIKAKIFKR